MFTFTKALTTLAETISVITNDGRNIVVTGKPCVLCMKLTLDSM